MEVQDFSEDGFLKQLMEIVEQHLDDPNFSIEQLCREAGVSRTHLHRKIKAATKLSTSHFIRKIRLEKASILLRQTDDNISEIAYQTGQSSPQNFSKYFIREYGLSPSAYRKQFQDRQRKETAGATLEPVAVGSEKVEQEQSPSRVRSGWLIPALLIPVLLLAGWGIWQSLSGPETIPDDAVGNLSPSIAVLPFQNYGGEEEAFFSEGVVEDILTYLTQFKDLRVISRTSSTQFKNSDKSIREIAGELEVSYILEGSVRQDSSEVRITAQLIRARDDQHVWAHRYDRPKKNVLELQAEVAKDIALSLNQKISPKMQEKLDRIPTPHIEAYNALLRGRYLQRNRTREALSRSIEAFDEALQLDPSYSEAYAGKATSLHLLANLRYVPGQETDYENMAERYALQAIKFDKGNGLAYGILGNVYSQQYRWEESIKAYEIALDLSPNDALLNYWFSLTLRAVGDLERAIGYHEIASQLDPLYPVIQAGYIYTCLLAGKFDLADRLLRKVKPVMGNSFLYYAVLGNSHMRKGAYKAAIAALEKTHELNPEFRISETDKIYSLGRLGETDLVQDYIVSLDTTRAIDCLRAAKAYISLDSTQHCLHYLNRASSLGLIQEDMLVEPMYAGLRTHPIFLNILKKFHLYAYLSSAYVTVPVHD